jgi:hypothetical protein
MGKGRLLFTPLPLELNDNIKVIGDVYRYALIIGLRTPLPPTPRPCRIPVL